MALFGVGFVLVVWAMLAAWVSNLARDRGRIAAGWALGAAVAGILAFAVGVGIVWSLADAAGATALAMLSLLIPTGLMAGAMVGLGLLLQLAPIRVTQRGEWPVHFIDRGPGRISLKASVVHIEWESGSRALPLDQLRSAEADGECVRISAEGLSLVAMPMGKPQTAPGRKEQSRVLAQALSATSGRASI